VWASLRHGRQPSRQRIHYHSDCDSSRWPHSFAAGDSLRGSHLKIKEIRTRVVRWTGKTVPLPGHFCTNPMDLVPVNASSMSTFTFHDWLIVEIFADNGLVGIGNAALSPQVTKQVIELYLKPILLGADPWNSELLWQQMYRKTMAFGRKGIGMVAISAVDIALWDLLGKSAKQPV